MARLLLSGKRFCLIGRLSPLTISLASKNNLKWAEAQVKCHYAKSCNILKTGTQNQVTQTQKLGTQTQNQVAHTQTQNQVAHTQTHALSMNQVWLVSLYLSQSFIV
jgi:hypothetical protein